MNEALEPPPAQRLLREIPVDTLTPVAALLRLRQQGQGCFLLESGGTDLNKARYSFIGVEPLETLSLRQGVLYQRLHSQADALETAPEIALEGEPLQLLKQKMEAGRCALDPDLPPFLGGYVGYLGYDIVRYLEPVELPTAADGLPEACVMRFEQCLVFDHLRHRILLVDHQGRGERLQILLERLHQPVAEERLLELPVLQGVAMPQGLMGQAAFCEKVLALKEAIRQGEIFQAVLSERFEAGFGADPFVLYRILRSLNPSPYLFYLDSGQEVLLGASPEMLVKSDGQQVSTCPIAGTRPRGRNRDQDEALAAELLACEKERAEHLMLVDLGRNDVGRVSQAGTVEVTRYQEVEYFSHVMHLVSLVEGKLEADKSAFDALLACFPAGTLSGAPKIRAMQLLAEHEGVARRWYGGSVFYHGFDGQLDACITIRSLAVHQGKVSLQAGAGIVADSIPEKEYEEVCNKAKATFQALALAQQLVAADPLTFPQAFPQVTTQGGQSQ